jgi:hypothetical protein
MYDLLRRTDSSGYIIFNVALVFVITWLFFGGYKKIVPPGTVDKVLRRGKATDSEKDPGESEETVSGTNFATRTDEEAEEQYVKDGETQAG